MSLRTEICCISMPSQVQVEDGAVCDRYTVGNDCVHLSSSSGVYLHEDLLAVLAVRCSADHCL